MNISHDEYSSTFLIIGEHDGEQYSTSIPVEALASWSELLGIDDPVEVLDAIKHVQEHGEPEPDPVTGENVWTDSYTLLQAREQAREREATKAIEEGTANDPRSPLLRATLAAHNTVHQPLDGGECVMDRCRRTARERLGIPWEPSKKPGAASRLTHRAATVTSEGSDVVEVEQALTPHSEVIELCRREFLHDLTDNNHNPLQDTNPLESEPEIEEPDLLTATIRKYGGK